jgi:excisionase family DNA binding protein
MDKFLSVEEVAARYDVTLGTVYDWIRHGRLSAMKIGKRYYIKLCDVSEMERQAAKVTNGKAESTPSD